MDEIREGRLSPDDVAIYSVERREGNSQFKRVNIEIDEHGRPEVLDPWDTNL